MIRRILEAIGIKKTHAHIPAASISDDEFEELLDIICVASKKSGRLASHLVPVQQLDQSSFAGTSIGHISMLPKGHTWPMHDDEPMLPLLQIRVSDLPQCPSELREFEYIFIWCAIESSPDMPFELLSELFEMTSNDCDQSEILDFYERNADKISIRYSPDPSVIRVLALPRGSCFEVCESKDPHEILNPHVLHAESITDSIDHWDGVYQKFLTPEIAKRCNTLYDRKLTSHQEKKINQATGNHECVKVGGWPTNLQGVIDFDGKAEFILQITSSRDYGLMLGDLGIIYIGYNKSTNEWLSDWSSY